MAAVSEADRRVRHAARAAEGLAKPLAELRRLVQQIRVVAQLVRREQTYPRTSRELK